ncbi:MAG: polysaccharide deacetylase family protein [Litorimonas sp.]
MMDRRFFLAGLAAIGACRDNRLNSTVSKHVKQMAITMDDFNLQFKTGLSQKARHENILSAFEAVGHKAAGFVTGDFVNTDWGQEVVQAWLDRGHIIANHTWTHPHANETDTDAYLSDIRQNQEYLSGVRGTSEIFRFPFLDDGRDREQQIKLFNGLDELGLRNAPVTMDSVDWYTASRLESALKLNPDTDLVPYRDYYVNMCVTLSNHWDQVAQALGFTSLPHLTLMHHNVLNGHFLKDVLLALKADGWVFIDAAEALAFPAFHPIPHEPTSGRNWLTLKARETEMEVAPYPEQYIGFGRKTMDALGL